MTDCWWVPREIVSVIRTRPVFLVRTAGTLPDLLERLCRGGRGRLLLVAAPRGGVPPPPAVRLDNPAFGAFAVDLVPAGACAGGASP